MPRPRLPEEDWLSAPPPVAPVADRGVAGPSPVAVPVADRGTAGPSPVAVPAGDRGDAVPSPVAVAAADPGVAVADPDVAVAGSGVAGRPPVAERAHRREPGSRVRLKEPSRAEAGGTVSPRARRGRHGSAAGRASRLRAGRWLWAAVAGIAVVAVAVAAVLYLTRATGRTHRLVIPDRLGAFVRKPQLEQQMNVRQLQRQIIARSAGQASHVVSAVYQDGVVAATGQPQIIWFIGGNLSGVSPSAFISSFTSKFGRAHAASPGSLGGSASCVTARTGAPTAVALCTWADSDTFGVVASPTMSLAQLSAKMRAIRPALERPAR